MPRRERRNGGTRARQVGTAEVSAVETLRRVLSGHEEVSALAFVSLYRSATREDPQSVIDLPQSAYLHGLQLAFEEGDLEALMEIALFGATVLASLGHNDQAVARIDQAVSMVGETSPERYVLLATKAFHFASVAEPLKARDALETVEGLPFPLDVRARAARASAHCILLELHDLEEHLECVSASRAAGHDAPASALMVQLVSAYAALGQFDEALSLASELSAFADEVGHGARGVDVAVARVAVERRGKFGPISRELLDEGVRLMNSPALLKLGLTEERRTTAVQDDAGSDAAGDLLRTHLRSLQPERLGLFAGVDAYQAVLTAPDTSVSVPPPEAPTLLSLPNVLASAEAVAIGGTVCGAADWLAWLEAELPANVVTSLEWPACRRRIEALLWLRMGHREVALECLRQSIELCGGRGDSIEAEIGRAQLAALVGDEDEAALAASRLLEVGIDASLFAEVATRVAARAALVEPALTVPEARVIGRVANGMSQREIEAELGLPSRGASRVTATGYPKLGVKGRAQVAQVARELQIV